MQDSLPLPLVQMGHVEKLAEVAQNQPQVQQQVLQETAFQALREQNSQVPVTDETEQAQMKSLQERHPEKRRRNDKRLSRTRTQPDDDKDPASESAPHEDNPWAGNIVNVTI